MVRVSQKKINYVRNTVIYSVCLLLVGFYPANVFAADDTTTPTTSTPTSSTPSDPSTTNTTPTPTTTPSSDSSPTSSSAPTTTSTPTAAPATTTTQQPKHNYYYDSSSNRWNTDAWKYDPATGVYKQAPAPQPVVVTPQTNGSSKLDSTTTTQIANALNSIAKTGNASVTGNTTGGSATSGNADASATIINNVNSSLTNANNAEAANFVTNITGDVNGDIILQPMLLKAMLEAGASNTAQDQSINSTNTTNLANDVNLTANSGNADVTHNTTAGNATSGNANTVADVVNIVNSMIAANQSFVGTINIYGNLNGDILIAPDFIPQLLASNGKSGSVSGKSDTTVNTSDTTSIVNNVALAANSGQAAVTNNTKGGNATTGSADTNLVIFNLTGHEIVACNSLLVFINVLGKWVGVIVDAPTGSTAAAIGNNVQQNTVTDPSLAINAVNTTQITNNLNLTSQTGDATVSGNTTAGNATSGNATASANIANIANSQLGLSGWFGILFINVYGTWLGSFGVDTSAGNPVAMNNPTGSTGSTGSKHTLQAIAYVPHAGAPQPTTTTTIVTPGNAVQVSSSTPEVKDAQVLSDIPTFKPFKQHAVNIPLAVGSLLVTLVSLYALRRFIF